MKTKILIECQQQIPSVRVGVLDPLRPLEAAGKCELRYMDTLDIKKTDIQWCDVIVCVRGSEYTTLQILKAAKKAGRFLVYFLDDDLLNIPDGLQVTDYYRDVGIRESLVGCLSLCDCLWVVNRRIAELYSRWCERWILSRVPATVVQPPPQSADKVRILYAGSQDHTTMVQEKLAPAIRRIQAEHPRLAEFVFIGADPGLQDTPGVTYYPFFDSYDEYRSLIADGNFVIGLAPGHRTQFFSCKYYNKFIEYTTFGICGIYENVDPYTQIVTARENGFLSGPTPEHWYVSLMKAIKNPDCCRNMAHRAQTILETQFKPDQVASRLQQDIPEFITYSAEYVCKKDILLPPARLTYYMARITLNFHVHGYKAVFVLFQKVFKKVMMWIRKFICKPGGN